MSPTRFHSPRALRLALRSSLVLLAAYALPKAVAVNKNNAGPEKVELKFNLPPPAPLSPEEELKTFKVEKGFRVELVAAEPLIESPVAVSFDDQGRLYVVEMRGYMHDVSGKGEDQPTGRISVLEDTDGDGRMDKATPFLDGLVMPRAVMAVNGGALVAEPPNLFFCKDTDGDGKADVKEVIATDYGTLGGQPEHMANTPVWTIDNSVWSAGYGTRFKLRGGVWQKDSGLGRGQWGLCQDDYGRLYFNYNSDMLRADLLPTEAFARNPLLRQPTAVNAKLAADQTIYPSHPTPGVNRGYDPKSLRPDGTLTKPTGTCGALIYRGAAFPAAYHGNAFVPEPCGNLVKRFAMSEADGMVKATNLAKNTEFLTSTDERFRPVQAADGPDGALYLVDMYRGIIQHQSFLTHYLIANILARKLEQPFNQGRIWRIVPDTQERPQPTRLPKDTAERLKLLSHPNGWVRDTAQRLLVESGDASSVPALRELLADAKSKPLTRLHALWTLDGLGAASAEVLRTALQDNDAQVRAAAVRMAPRDFAPDLMALTQEKSVIVLANLAIKLTSFNLPEADTAVAKLVAAHGKQALVREGALTGLRGREATFAKQLAAEFTPKNSANIAPMIEALGSLVAQAGKAGLFEDMLQLAAGQTKAASLQVAALKGLATTGADAKAKNAKPAKLVWLEAEPTALKTLKTSLTENKSAGQFFTSVEARLAWPGKPGAPPPPKVVPLNAAQTALFEKGKTIYSTLCAACHQPHGFGLDGLAPPLVDSEWVLGKADITARIVMHGLAGPVKVGGRSFNLAMPPLPQLTDEDIAGVLTYIRREWEHNASPVDVKTISSIRAESKGRAAMWTEQELKNLGKKSGSK